VLHEDDQDHRRGDDENLVATFVEQVGAERDLRLGPMRGGLVV